MSHALILSIPSHGHMNPLLGLANELVQGGEQITFFSSGEFESSIQSIGAQFIAYKEDMNIFKKSGVESRPKIGLFSALLQPQKFIDEVLAQIGDATQYDYLIFSAAYPYATVIAHVLHLPSVSSLAVFMPIKKMIQQKRSEGDTNTPFGLSSESLESLQIVRKKVEQQYDITLPGNPLDLMLNKGDINLVYTSRYFMGSDADEYDSSYLFIGPPVFNKQYDISFPFEQLEGKEVIYISLGTMFGNHSQALNQSLFDAFRDTAYTIVIAAHGVDDSLYNIPGNFIIKDFVPQLDVLPYTTAAITHAGMNSIGDLLYHNIPFVSIPLGADQFYLAARAAELGATIVLDASAITPGQIRESVEEVIHNPAYRYNEAQISHSFKDTGGFERAVQEICKLKKEKAAMV